MKEFIYFYYGIKINDVKQINEYYTFKYNSYIYYLIPYNYDENHINGIINISKILLKNSIKSHIVVINKDNKYVSSIDDNNYVLLQIISTNEELSIIDINNYQKNIIYENNKHIQWSLLWANKNDYFEKAVLELKKDPIIEKTLDYYLGLSENAIIYYDLTISNYNEKKQVLTWSHKRVYYPNMTINYFNPLN